MSSTYSPRGEGTENTGWFRIGRYDSARRRALWARIVLCPWDDEEWAGAIRAEVAYIELCAGREGDDAYVKIDRKHPCFVDLEDCISRAACHIECEPELCEGRPDEPYREQVAEWWEVWWKKTGEAPCRVWAGQGNPVDERVPAREGFTTRKAARDYVKRSKNKYYKIVRVTRWRRPK